MNDLWSKIPKKPSRKPIDVVIGEDDDGGEIVQKFDVLGMTRSEKNKLVSDCTEKGVLDSDQLECRVLAYCICEPDGGPQVQPLWQEWVDIPSEYAGPLVAQCSKLCGFDDSELVRAGATAKKSETTAS